MAPSYYEVSHSSSSLQTKLRPIYYVKSTHAGMFITESTVRPAVPMAVTSMNWCLRHLYAIRSGGWGREGSLIIQNITAMDILYIIYIHPIKKHVHLEWNQNTDKESMKIPKQPHMGVCEDFNSGYLSCKHGIVSWKKPQWGINHSWKKR